jgi:hypothetical protein
MTASEEAWYDDDAGPLVRPYAVTGGRTGVLHDLDLITLVVAVDQDAYARIAEPDHALVLRVCAHPCSVAEVAAHLDQPLGVAKVLISDLIECGLLVCSSGSQPTAPDLSMMQKVLNGIRNL